MLHELRDDPQLGARDVAFSKKRMRALVRDRVVPRAFPQLQLARLSRVYTAYKPGKHHTTLFRLEFEGTDWWTFATVTFDTERRLDRLRRRHHPEATEREVQMVADVPCLVELFPSDWRLAGLAPAVGLEQVELSDGTRSLVRACNVLRYRARRACVLDYELADRHLIGKVYTTPDKARLIERKLEVLAPCMAERGFRTPRLGATSDIPELVLMERLPGDSAARRFDGAAGETTAKLAARALAALHELDLELSPEPPRVIGSELEDLLVRAEAIGLVAPAFHERVKAVLERLRSAVSELGSETPPLGLVHGDYKPSQLLVDGESLAIVDPDRASTGDAAVDVGNFLASLHKDAATEGRPELRRLASVFLETYEQRAPRGSVRERALLFRSIALVRMAVRMFERGPHAYARKRDAWPALEILAEAEALPRGYRGEVQP